MPSPRPLLAVLAVVVASTGALVASPAARAAERNLSSLASAPVTVYGAKWCPACRALETGLRDRKIAFDLVDVDDNPGAFARARSASGAGGAIPLTGVARTSGTVWIVGADVDAVDRAQRGE